ncbi:MAG TPA: DMT family transporter [Rubrivivax sp.]|nr:DMT family transporter [Rubrivivax sp.]
MSADRTQARRAVIVLALLSLIWGYNWVVMKLANHYAGPFQFTALRCVFGALVLFAALLLRRASLRLIAPGPTLLLGLLQTAAFTGLAQWALVSGGAGKTAVLVYTMPFWLLLLAWPLLGERLRRAQWPAVIVAAAGLLLIVEPWRLRGTLLSDGLAIASGLVWAASAIVAKKLRERHQVDLLSLTAWQMLFGSLVLVVVALAVPAPPLVVSAELVALTAFIAIFGTGLGWLMWLYVLDQMPASTAGLGSLAIPAIGVLASWLQLGERPGVAEFAGMLLIIAGLALLSFAGRRGNSPGRAPAVQAKASGGEPR